MSTPGNGPMYSLHEGWAIIEEDTIEFRDLSALPTEKMVKSHLMHCSCDDAGITGRPVPINDRKSFKEKTSVNQNGGPNHVLSQKQEPPGISALVSKEGGRVLPGGLDVRVQFCATSRKCQA